MLGRSVSWTGQGFRTVSEPDLTRTHPAAGPPEDRAAGDAPTRIGRSAPPSPYPFLGPPQQPDEMGRLGRYRVLFTLGRGGMGVVFRAEDPALGRAVAIKAMLPVYAGDSGARARFVREARAQAAIEHEHVTPIFDIADDGATPFFAMPLLRGKSLAGALTTESRPPLTTVLRITREIAEGLAAAHERGLIHRDIKPSNIWLEGDRGRVKILDFGLARVADPSDPTAPDPHDTCPVNVPVGARDILTAPGSVIGTPQYMSPEQASGEPVGPPTDVFSLGVVLYEMVTGRLPFDGPTGAEMMAAVRAANPTPPSTLVPGLPPPLDALIQHMLARNPAERPRSAMVLAEELRRLELGLTAAMPTELIPLDRGPAQPNTWEEIDTPAEPVLSDAGSQPRPRGPRRPRRALWGWVVAGVAVVVGAALLTGILVRASAPLGVIVIETDDANLEITLRRGSEVVRDRTRDRTFPLPPGEYTIELAESQPDWKIRPDRVMLAKSDRERVQIWRESTRVKPPQPPPAPIDQDASEREAAAALLPYTRELWLLFPPTYHTFKVYGPGRTLPDPPFVVGLIFLRESGLKHDFMSDILLPAVEKTHRLTHLAGGADLLLYQAGLDRLAATPSRETLVALRIPVLMTQEALTTLTRFPSLRQLWLRAGPKAGELLPKLENLSPSLDQLEIECLARDARINEEGLKSVARLKVEEWIFRDSPGVDIRLAAAVAKQPKLKVLRMIGCEAGNDHLAALAGTMTLVQLDLQRNQIGDAGLAKLTGLPNLRLLDVRGNPDVTATAVNAFAAANLRCEITWDGGNVPASVK